MRYPIFFVSFSAVGMQSHLIYPATDVACAALH